MAILHPQEIFMIERYTSLERLKKLHETWAEFLTKSRGYLDAYAKNPPKDPSLMETYEKVITAGRVKFFPYCESWLASINEGCLLLKHNDLRGIAKVGSPGGTFYDDFWGRWLSPTELEYCDALRSKAYKFSMPIKTSAQKIWAEGELTYMKDIEDPINLGPRNLPPKLPVYDLDHSTRLEIGQPIKEPGIYLPDIDRTAASILLIGKTIKASQGQKLEKSEWSKNKKYPYYNWVEEAWVETGWTMVKRIEGEYIDVPEEGFFPQGLQEELYAWGEAQKEAEARDTRIKAFNGHPCPQAGLWHTAAQPGQHRFEQGEIMPKVIADQVEPGTTFTNPAIKTMTRWYFDQA